MENRYGDLNITALPASSTHNDNMINSNENASTTEMTIQSSNSNSAHNNHNNNNNSHLNNNHMSNGSIKTENQTSPNNLVIDEQDSTG